MCFVFTCGEHTFRKEVEGYEGVVCRCYNCGNYSGKVVKSHPWFTFCFIVRTLSRPRASSLPPADPTGRRQPVIPYTIKGHTDIVCHICNFQQALEHRADVQAMKHGGNGVPLQQREPPGREGWGGRDNHSPPRGNQPMRYG